MRDCIGAFPARDVDDNREIQSWHQPYDVAKLLSIEIFGRLFGARQSVAEVEEFVRRVAEPVG